MLQTENNSAKLSKIVRKNLLRHQSKNFYNTEWSYSIEREIPLSDKTQFSNNSLKNNNKNKFNPNPNKHFQSNELCVWMMLWNSIRERLYIFCLWCAERTLLRKYVFRDYVSIVSKYATISSSFINFQNDYRWHKTHHH